MKILFQCNTICHRGTTVAVKDYARFNQEILGNESIIAYPSNYYDPGVSPDSLTQQDVLDDLKTKYNVVPYASLQELDSICEKQKIDAAYFIKAGFDDGLLSRSTKNLVHAVFQANQPHGDKYAYVSRWLSRHMSNGDLDYVPHVVDLPETRKNDIRKILNIPEDKIVIGRHGGLHQFDIPFVLQTVFDVVCDDDSFVFVFLNTAKFAEHRNLIFLNPIVDPQIKSDYIQACDAMLHARTGGESFGLAVCEFLFHNKPVLAWENGTDQHHVDLLAATDNLYNINNLKQKIYKLKSKEIYNYNYKNIVSEFSPKNVMAKFDEVFLK